MSKIRCSICGKFIGYQEDSHIDFTPDTEYTEEETVITHQECLKKDTK